MFLTLKLTTEIFLINVRNRAGIDLYCLSRWLELELKIDLLCLGCEVLKSCNPLRGV
jgi:hypothetical protein